MTKVIEAIKKIYPEIKGGFVYWETKHNGDPLENPIDGLVWENKDFPKPSWEEISKQLVIVELEEATQAKIKEIKAQRDANLCKPTPQTVTYGGKLSNRTFNINVKEHLPIFNSIITILQSKVDAGAINPTRTWTDANGDVLELELSDYVSLANHLDFRDAQEFAMCSKRIKALDGLSLEKVENFDITQIIE